MMALPDLLTPAVRSFVGVSSTLAAFRLLLVVAEGCGGRVRHRARKGNEA